MGVQKIQTGIIYILWFAVLVFGLSAKDQRRSTDDLKQDRSVWIMQQPIAIDFAALPWQPHPTIPGIVVRVFQNQAAFAPTDMLIARVAAGGQIPWHVHPVDTEIAYVLQGAGVLYSAETEAHEPASETPMNPDSGVIIPPRLWHAVQNTSAEEMIIVAVHTPA
jgi:mannose-6-phosphate isomerase-like protein (cupin superfamily)